MQEIFDFITKNGNIYYIYTLSEVFYHLNEDILNFNLKTTELIKESIEKERK